MNPTDILIFIFIVIFSATAILTICALPGWIKIPDTYLKILFSSLLLEVIAFVFVMVNKGTEPKHDCKEKHWVVLNEKGNISTLSIDSIVISSDLGDFSSEAREHAKFNLVKEECDDGLKYFIKKDSFCIGYIAPNDLKSLNKIDTIILSQLLSTKEQTSEKAFINLKYTKESHGQEWKRAKENGYEMELPKDWNLNIYTSNGEFFISDTLQPHLYNKHVGSFNDGYRTLHSLKEEGSNCYYMLQITSARNSGDLPYHVIFTAIRIETALNN